MPFNNSEVDARFDMTGADQRINYRSYSGMLSDAPLAIVEGMVDRKSNLVKRKPPKAPKGSTPADTGQGN